MIHEHYQNEGNFDCNKMYCITCNLQIFVSMLRQKNRAIPVRQINVNT